MSTTLSTQNLAFQKKNINGIKEPPESNVSYKCRLVWGVPVSFISHLFFPSWDWCLQSVLYKVAHIFCLSVHFQCLACIDLTVFIYTRQLKCFQPYPYILRWNYGIYFSFGNSIFFICFFFCWFSMAVMNHFCTSQHILIFPSACPLESPSHF